MQNTQIPIPEQPTVNPEDEIRKLEQMLAEKRAALSQSGRIRTRCNQRTSCPPSEPVEKTANRRDRGEENS